MYTFSLLSYYNLKSLAVKLYLASYASENLPVNNNYTHSSNILKRIHLIYSSLLVTAVYCL